MKKLFLFLAASALALTSCSSDDDGGSSIGGTITVTINGQAKTFNSIVVNEQVFDAGTPNEYTDLTVTGTIGSSTDEIIVFELEKGDLGANAIYFMTYTKNNNTYFGDFSANVTTNNNSKVLKGNFSGTFFDNGGSGSNEAVFTNGSFDIQY